VIVVGDFFLDKYLVTDPLLSERSVETGLEARQVVEVRVSPGAAGTVTNNLCALGVSGIHAVGAIGADGEGHDLLTGLQARGVNANHLRAYPGRFTPTYMKPMVCGSFGERELERLDLKNRTPLPSEAESAIIDGLTQLLGEINELPESNTQCQSAVIIADQVQERDCGVITDCVREQIAELALRHPRVVFLADSRERIGEFRNVVVKPNQHEAARATALRSEVGLVAWEAAEVAVRLSLMTERPVFLTMGEDGIMVADEERVTHVLAMRAPAEIDIVGAGDSVTAGIVSALCTGATPVESAAMGNLCASVTIRKLGTTGTASPAELREAWREF
jgi:rfaE bifunctional protein kinase chain/domain